MNTSLRGVGFNNIPTDAVGIVAIDNSLPLQYRTTESPRLLLTIAEKSDTRVLMTQDEEQSHSLSSYLGAIVSADRRTVYWVNDTSPLP